MQIHELLDFNFGESGETDLKDLLRQGAGVNDVDLSTGESPLHVATRRRRVAAIEILLEHGAEIDRQNRFGKTAFVHAKRRGFADVVAILLDQGADPSMTTADDFAVKVVDGDLDGARRLLQLDPSIVCTGNPEEDRLLADVSGRPQVDSVKFLIDAGASLTVPALDHGTPLHQAAWFGQPPNARLLIDAGAPLEIFDMTHFSSPLGWAIHGSRYSGGAEDVQKRYADLVRMFLAAGSLLHYPSEPHDSSYRKRLVEDASPAIRQILEENS